MGAETQMGPASLPTPLSPTRGLVRRRALGVRCFAVLLRRNAEVRVCHRRSHRHPDPPSGGFRIGAPGRSLRLPPHPPPSTGGSAVGCRKPVPRTVAPRRVRRPSKRPLGRRPDDPARERNDFALPSSSPSLRAEALAEGFSGCARTGPATSSRFGIIQGCQVVRPSNPDRFRPVPMSRNCPRPSDSTSAQDRSFPLSPDFVVDGGG